MECLVGLLQQTKLLRRTVIGFCDQPGSAQEAVIFPGIVLAVLVPTLDVFHLYAQYRRLHSVEAAVPSDLVVIIALLAAMVGERANVIGNCVIIGRDQAAIAIRT